MIKFLVGLVGFLTIIFVASWWWSKEAVLVIYADNAQAKISLIDQNGFKDTGVGQLTYKSKEISWLYIEGQLDKKIVATTTSLSKRQQKNLTLELAKIPKTRPPSFWGTGATSDFFVDDSLIVGLSRNTSDFVVRGTNPTDSQASFAVWPKSHKVHWYNKNNYIASSPKKGVWLVDQGQIQKQWPKALDFAVLGQKIFLLENTGRIIIDNQNHSQALTVSSNIGGQQIFVGQRNFYLMGEPKDMKGRAHLQQINAFNHQGDPVGSYFAADFVDLLEVGDQLFVAEGDGLSLFSSNHETSLTIINQPIVDLLETESGIYALTVSGQVWQVNLGEKVAWLLTESVDQRLGVARSLTSKDDKIYFSLTSDQDPVSGVRGEIYYFSSSSA